MQSLTNGSGGRVDWAGKDETTWTGRGRCVPRQSLHSTCRSSPQAIASHAVPAALRCRPSTRVTPARHTEPVIRRRSPCHPSTAAVRVTGPWRGSSSVMTITIYPRRRSTPTTCRGNKNASRRCTSSAMVIS